MSSITTSSIHLIYLTKLTNQLQIIKRNMHLTSKGFEMPQKRNQDMGVLLFAIRIALYMAEDGSPTASNSLRLESRLLRLVQRRKWKQQAAVPAVPKERIEQSHLGEIGPGWRASVRKAERR